MATNPGLRAWAGHDHQVRRLVNLYVGLVLFGLSIALMVRSELGLSPWDVFHQGVSNRSGVPIGVVVISVSAVVLLLWIPLRQRPGLGTVSNVIVVGLAVDLGLLVLPEPPNLATQALLLGVGVVANGVATGSTSVPGSGRAHGTD